MCERIGVSTNVLRDELRVSDKPRITTVPYASPRFSACAEWDAVPTTKIRSDFAYGEAACSNRGRETGIFGVLTFLVGFASCVCICVWCGTFIGF